MKHTNEHSTDRKNGGLNTTCTLMALMVTMVAMLTSCAAFEEPVFCISLHQFAAPKDYAPETLLIHQVNDINGVLKGSVSQFPIVDSSSFGQVQLVKGEQDKWGLRLVMDKRGTNLWRQATAEFQGQKLAILLDGFYVATMEFPPYTASGIIMIPPIWSEKEARQIAQHVKSNYEHFND